MAAEFKEFMSLVISFNFLAIHTSLSMLTFDDFLGLVKALKFLNFLAAKVLFMVWGWFLMKRFMGNMVREEENLSSIKQKWRKNTWRGFQPWEKWEEENESFNLFCLLLTLSYLFM